MAGIPWAATKSAMALTAATAKTLLQLVAATNTRELVEECEVTFNGITPTDPGILVELITQSSAGTMTSLTPVKTRSSDTETLQLTAQHTATVEPGTTAVIASAYANEQGVALFVFPKGSEFPLVGGTRLGARVTPGTLTAATLGSVTFRGTE